MTCRVASEWAWIFPPKCRYIDVPSARTILPICSPKR